MGVWRVEVEQIDDEALYRVYRKRGIWGREYAGCFDTLAEANAKAEELNREEK